MLMKFGNWLEFEIGWRTLYLKIGRRDWWLER